MIRSLVVGIVLAALGLAPCAVAQDTGAAPMQSFSAVKLRALDKITGNSRDLSAKVGDSLTFGRLRVTVRACYQADPRETPESAAFLEVRSTTPTEKQPVADKPGQYLDHEQGAAAHWAGWLAVLGMDVCIEPGPQCAGTPDLRRLGDQLQRFLT
jgi:hypothetical protein